MIKEVVFITLPVEKGEAFEKTFQDAVEIIEAIDGYAKHEIRRCVETPGKYMLTIDWETYDSHMVNFVQSPAFEKWNQKIGHFFDEGTVTMEHYTL